VKEVALEEDEGPEFTSKPEPIVVEEKQEIVIVATIKGGCMSLSLNIQPTSNHMHELHRIFPPMFIMVVYVNYNTKAECYLLDQTFLHTVFTLKCFLNVLCKKSKRFEYTISTNIH